MSPAAQRHPHRRDHVEADIDAVLGRLRDGGGRVTTGRRAIVRCLLTADDHHVTAEGLAAMVQADHPDVHLSTVYRTLDALEHLGVVARINLGSDSAVFHLTDPAHHHLVCDVCGSVTEVDKDVLATMGIELERAYGFQVSPRHLSLTGICSACQERTGAG